MRRALRQLLIAATPAIEGRWYEPHGVPGGDTTKPFGVLRVGVAAEQDPWQNQATLVEAWPYAAPDSYVNVDTLADQCVAALDLVRFAGDAGEPYLSEFAGDVAADGWDTEWRALTHPVRFRVFDLRWLSGLTAGPVAGAGDPVLAVRTHTESLWPGALQTDPDTWDPQDTRPGAYFRLVTSDVQPFGRAIARRRYTLAGHVVAPDATVRLEWTRALTEGFQAAGGRWCRMPDTANGRPLEFLRVAADATRHPLREGQLRLDTECFAQAAQPPPGITPVLEGPVLPLQPMPVVLGAIRRRVVAPQDRVGPPTEDVYG